MPTLQIDQTLDTGHQGVKRALRGDDFEADVLLDTFNQRVRVIHYSGQPTALSQTLRDLAAAHELSKVVILAGAKDWDGFVSQGYVMEGLVPCGFEGEPAFFMARFLSGDRRFSAVYDKEDELFRTVMDEPADAPDGTPPPGFALEPATPDDAEELAALYDTVFDSYPTPLNQADHVREIMVCEEIFWVCRHEGKIVSAASGAVEPGQRAAEMTACATLPDFRGHGLMQCLLIRLEQHLCEEGYRCLYSTARALSPGINRAFRRLGYTFGGRLVNHCHIMGRFEDMNLWVRELG